MATITALLSALTLLLQPPQIHALALPTNNRLTAPTTPPPSTLPPVTPGLTLKYAALGLGTQNYTCATATTASTPLAVGANATLYYATPIVAVSNFVSNLKFTIPTYAASVSGSSHSAINTHEDILNRTTCTADQRNTAGPLKELGHHFFTSAGVPTFDLSAENLYLSAAKVAASPAPANSCSGRDEGAAVPWLKLVDSGVGATRGLKEVYRVETTGGAAPATCDGLSGLVTRDYSAFYYFYG